MINAKNAAHDRIDAYLAKLRKRLRDLNEEEVCEIVDELRSHILERGNVNGEVTLGGVDAALATLGSPEQLAGEYLTDNLLVLAEVSRSPLRILEILFRWASLSVAGFLVFLTSIVGYFLGIACVLCALLKPVHPQSAGLWIYPVGGGDSEISLRLGFGNPAPDGRDLLGWWIVPIGLVVGSGLVMLTTRFGLWCLRRYRLSRMTPG